MKKIAIITCAVALLFTASLKAQTDTVPVTPETPVTTKPGSSDKWNNHDPAKYQLQPMPSPLTTAQIFPAAGSYSVTNKEGVASNLILTLDETNKGIVWIDGLPEGRVKAYLRKSPGTYKIPEQKLGEEKDAKTVPEGVLIYDKDANSVNVCIGCKYNAEDAASVFLPEPVTTEPVVEETVKNKKATAKTKAAKAKEVKVQPVFYSGSKTIAEAQSTSETMQPVVEQR
ncbi:MAG: hypothetical protein WDN26_11085 [Chitinophagaceae bacterium]